MTETRGMARKSPHFSDRLFGIFNDGEVCQQDLFPFWRKTFLFLFVRRKSETSTFSDSIVRSFFKFQILR
jgi:hypothetical protein